MRAWSAALGPARCSVDDAAELINVNTPADLAAAEARLAEG